MGPESSTPTTQPTLPTARATASATRPVPQATSRTHSPEASAAAAMLQRQVQRYGWDIAAVAYASLWQSQLAGAQASVTRRRHGPRNPASSGAGDAKGEGGKAPS